MGLFLLAAGAGAFSSIMKGRMADAQGRAQEALFNRNALIAKRDASARLRKARFDQLQQVREGERIKGRLIARLGASGARLDVGAPIQLLNEQAAVLDLDNALIGFEGRVEAARFREEAVQLKFRGRIARQRGRAAQRAAFIGAGSSLLTDFAIAKAQGIT